MNVVLLSHDISSLVSGIPLPVLVLAAVVLVLVTIGLLSRARAMVKGQASPLDYAGMFLILVFFGLVALLIIRAAFKTFSLP